VRVTFFLSGEHDFDRLRALDPDSAPDEFLTGERCWVLQTYLHLAAAGHPVELSGRLPGDGTLVFHSKQVEALLRYWRRWSRCVFVGVRADHTESHLADFEVLQNRVWEDGVRRFFIPHWPQPGLVPRDLSRGERVERVAFKGRLGSLAEDVCAPAFARELDRRGIELELDVIERPGVTGAHAGLHWADYSEVDLVIALRPGNGRYSNKPASKLYNAWRAGVPAVLGPEPAYRELRRHELDYLEVTSAAEALAAIDRLRADPALYHAMVEHGRTRGESFSPESIRELWADLLFQRIPALASARPLRSVPAVLRPAIRKADRLLRGRPSR
jgi:hypothetical protein